MNWLSWLLAVATFIVVVAAVEYWKDKQDEKARAGLDDGE